MLHIYIIPSKKKKKKKKKKHLALMASLSYNSLKLMKSCPGWEKLISKRSFSTAL